MGELLGPHSTLSTVPWHVHSAPRHRPPVPIALDPVSVPQTRAALVDTAALTGQHFVAVLHDIKAVHMAWFTYEYSGIHVYNHIQTKCNDTGATHERS